MQLKQQQMLTRHSCKALQAIEHPRHRRTEQRQLHQQRHELIRVSSRDRDEQRISQVDSTWRRYRQDIDAGNPLRTQLRQQDTADPTFFCVVISYVVVVVDLVVSIMCFPKPMHNSSPNVLVQ
ncbi:hypothetical protein PHYSODRAFT_284711 [Phytophthora sojae]|uniref:Uncharacterized protein n=1 Tax=Phytophthora sojae (strain P6497) TaxID=1094619 RepID=G4YWM7_PHYSP|nr:hypothetical protein PHYSODRAFT_284711 [Phytophthora sojae]EGZ23208.1 hypothetical protein PHYSODRAFT_284711 [Phytophthora sojae]|eukprot:XP_009518496.1 hypothetical protein PHYSODRAFT_284711 [Phytophthora sojae]